MGVQGLWQLLEPTGSPVSLESLEGKILAIDISIWLNQLVKGMRDSHGNQVANAHLVGLFTRVCKLLYYRIKPVFVFDGGVPALKKHTLAQRRQQKEEAKMASTKTNRKLLQAVLKRHAVGAALGSQTKTPKSDSGVAQGDASDIFDLPPMPQETLPDSGEHDGESPESPQNRLAENCDHEHYDELYGLYEDPADIDVESEDFKALPPEIQLEIITDLRDSRKRNAWKDIHKLPENSDDFSNYQMAKLLKQNHLSSKLNDVRKQLNMQETGELAKNLAESQNWDTSIETQRLASADSSHYILVRGLRDVQDQQTTNATESGADECSVVDGNDSRGRRARADAAMANQDSNNATENRYIPAAGPNTRTKMGVAYPPAFDTVDLSSSDDEPEIVDVNKASDVSIGAENFVKNGLGSERQDKKDRLTNSKDNLPSHVHEAVEDSARVDITNVSVVENDVLAQSSDHKTNLLEIPEDPTNNKHELQNQIKQNDILPTPAKKQRLDLKAADTSLDLGPDTEAVVEVSDEEEESDEDFIEVVIDPKNCQPDEEMFPASIFFTSAPTEPSKEAVAAGGAEQPVSAAGVGTVPDAGRDLPEFPEEIPSPAENEFLGITKTELLDLQHVLDEETRELKAQRGQQERMGASITDQMYAEAQDLLSLFGLPFITSPTEAEAQCAFLDMSEQTQGSITDDSDIWLFGGRRVYKNFFNKNKDVSFFKFSEIHSQLLLDREKMIQMALLCGSDYTDGIQGVGPVTAMEILEEFRGSGHLPLQNLRKWWDKIQTERKVPTESKLRTKLRKLEIKEGFPNQRVIDAYLHPTLDESTENFSWSKPDLDLLRQFAETKLGWHRAKSDELLLPVFKQLNQSHTQLHITKFLAQGVNKSSQVKSKRIRNSLARMKTMHREEPAIPASNAAVPARRTKGKMCRGAKSKNSRPVNLDRDTVPEDGGGGGWVPSRRPVCHQVELSESSSDSDHGSMSVEFDSDSSVDDVLGAIDLQEFERDSEDLP